MGIEANVPIVSAREPLVLVMVMTLTLLTLVSPLVSLLSLILCLRCTEELEQLGQIMVKQLKNRYNDPTTNKRFVVGIDRARYDSTIVNNLHRMIF